MGLAIGYDIHAPADWDDDDVRAILATTRQRALELAFARVSEIEANDPLEPQWLVVRRQPKNFPRVVLSAKAESGWFFHTWPGRGCETARFGLCRFPARVADEGRSIAHGWGSGWHYHTSCKTQYADLVSREHFLNCHLGVIAVLDHLRELGCRVHVRDDGGYWRSRSLDLLARRIEEMHALVAAFTGVLKDAVRHSPGQLVAPITQSSRFEHLEAKGRAEIARKRQQRKRRGRER